MNELHSSEGILRQPPLKVALSELHSYSHMKAQFYARNGIIRCFSSDLRLYPCFLAYPRVTAGQKINYQLFRWFVLFKDLRPRPLHHTNKNIQRMHADPI